MRLQAGHETDDLREHIAALESELSTVPARLQQLIDDVRIATSGLITKHHTSGEDETDETFKLLTEFVEPHTAAPLITPHQIL